METTPMNKQELLAAHKEYLFPSVFHYFKEPLAIVRAKDQFVWDIDGNQYLDFFGGIVTVSVGHCNDSVNARVREQLEKLQHVSTVFSTEPQVALARRLSGLVPGGGPMKSFFTNSGTEANEAAVLAARCFTGASEIVALRHSYHGRSALAMSMTGQATWRLGNSPQPGIVHAHNAYCYRCPFHLEYPSCDLACARDMEELIRTTTSGRIAGFIGEPIQGVGGFITPPKEYFGIVAKIVRDYGGIFIADEVQTAWGRTGGKWFGIEHWGVVPDVITSAKGLANGLPIGVTIARREVADSIRGVTISTFGGNPVTTTAAHAVIDYIDQNRIPDNTAAMGAYLRGRLDELKDKHPLIGDVRGMGLLQAIELVEDRASKRPAPRQTAEVMEACRERGVLVGKGGMYGNALRLSPPMNIGKSDIDQLVAALDAGLAKVGLLGSEVHHEAD
jgi:4-aminobutyrate aminotransferase